MVKVGAQSGVGWRITSVALSGAAPSCAALVMYALQYARTLVCVAQGRLILAMLLVYAQAPRWLTVE